MLLENEKRDWSFLADKICEEEKETVVILSRDGDKIEVDRNRLQLISPLMISVLTDVGCCKSVSLLLPDVSARSVKVLMSLVQTGSCMNVGEEMIEEVELVGQLLGVKIKGLVMTRREGGIRGLRVEDMERLLASHIKREDIEYSEVSVKEETEDGEIFNSNDKRVREEEELSGGKRNRTDSLGKTNNRINSREQTYSRTDSREQTYGRTDSREQIFSRTDSVEQTYRPPTTSSHPSPGPSPQPSQFYNSNPSPRIVTIQGANNGSPSLVPVQYITSNPYYQTGKPQHESNEPPHAGIPPQYGSHVPPQSGVPPQYASHGPPPQYRSNGPPHHGVPPQYGSNGPLHAGIQLQYGSDGPPEVGASPQNTVQCTGPCCPPVARRSFVKKTKNNLSWNQMSLDQKLDITCEEWNRGKCSQRDGDFCFFPSGVKSRHACNLVVDYGHGQRLCWGKHARVHHFKN